MRLLLFAGTGGAGTTTVAAATAVHAARRGVKTLLLTPEPAAGPGRAAGLPGPPATSAGAGGPVEIEPGLFAHHVDARARDRRGWQAAAAPLTALLEALGVEPLDQGEFTGLPGLDDVLTLLEIRDAADAGWDLVVVDTPGLARTLRLLALPEAAVRSVERILPLERRMLWAMGHGASPTASAVPSRGLVETAERLAGELAGTRETLTASGTSVRLVLTPEAGSLSQGRHARTTLALHGLAADGIVVNRLVPASGDDPWRQARATAQAAVLADADASFAPLTVARVAERAAPPATPADLAELAGELYGDALPHEEHAGGPATSSTAHSTGTTVERCGDEYVLVLPLPLADREDLELGRRGDELVLVLGGERRIMALPSVLRRCEVTGAALRAGALRVGFRPDAALWRSL